MLLDNNERSSQAIAIFWCVILVSGLTIVNNVVYLAVTESSTLSTISGIATGLLSLMELAVLVLSIICFIRWFRRAYANLERVGVSIEHKENWAAGAWFVPFLNLVRPYTIMREIWRDTQFLACDSVQSHGLLRWWWAAYLVKDVVVNLSSRVVTGVETSLQLLTTAGLFANVFKIISALLTIAVIRRVSNFEQQLAFRQQVEAIGGSAPEPVDVGATEEELYY